MEDNFCELKQKIDSATKIGIISHTVPDADAVGSSCGLAYTLKAMGKKVEVLFEKPLKKEFDMFGLDDVVAFSPSFEYDLFISTDSGDTTRFGINEHFYTQHKNTVNIDHHLTNDKYAKLNFVDSKRSSASEYIYYILNKLGYTIPLKSLNLFYTGIIRDCGAFMHDNTSATTHRIVADLFDKGINFGAINQHFMQSNSLNSIILEKYAFNTMEFFGGNKIVLMHIPLEVFEKENCSLEDSGAIVSIGISIENVELAIMCSEAQKNVHKISFRSKNLIDSSQLSQKFGGGGHKKAAGCQLKGTFDFIKNQLLTEVNKQIKIGDNNEWNNNPQ